MIILALESCMFSHLIYLVPGIQTNLEMLPVGVADEMVNLLNHSIGWFVIVCIFIPICEELFFKGIILNDFIKNLGVKKGILFGAVIFGVLHQYSAAFVFLIYLIVGHFYYRKKNIYYAIIFHISNNSFAVLLGNLLRNWDKTDIAKVGTLGIIILAFEIFLMYKKEHVVVGNVK